MRFLGGMPEPPRSLTCDWRKLTARAHKNGGLALKNAFARWFIPGRQLPPLASLTRFQGGVQGFQGAPRLGSGENRPKRTRGAGGLEAGSTGLQGCRAAGSLVPGKEKQHVKEGRENNPVLVQYVHSFCFPVLGHEAGCESACEP